MKVNMSKEYGLKDRVLLSLDMNLSELTLSDIVSPLSVSDFTTHFLNKTFCYIKGAEGRFSHLLPWDVLSRILEEHRLDYPRLRLVRRGDTLPPQTYLDYKTDRRGAKYVRVRLAGIERELSEGAMLHLAAVEELYEPIRQFADVLTKELQAKILVNVCAGTDDSKGFATHWDGHDVLVLQVQGKKYWRVYGITEPSPLRIGKGMDAGGSDDKPVQAVWEGMLEQGDVLYLPRGCWHSAQGTEGPTLHLTVGIINPTGVEFLGWIGQQLLSVEAFRKDISTLYSETYRSDYIVDVAKAISTYLTTDALNKFLLEEEEKRKIEPKLNLPHTIRKTKNIYANQ